MMRRLIAAALRQRVLTVALAALLIVFGLHSARVTPLDVFPEFAPPLVEIQTEAPGLSTEEVESLVTVPLENALNGTAVAEDASARSRCSGLSSVVLIFEDGTDLHAGPPAGAGAAGRSRRRLPAVAQAAGDPARRSRRPAAC